MAKERDLVGVRVIAIAAAAGASFIGVAVALLYRGRVRGQGPAALLRAAKRRDLIEAIRAEPGLTAADLAERVGVSHNNALYHLRLLQKADLVRFVRREGPRSHLRVFPSSAAPKGASRSAFLELSSPHARVIMGELLAAAGTGCTTDVLAHRVRLPSSTIGYHLRRFERAHLVVVEEAENRLVYAVPDAVRDDVARAFAWVGGSAPARRADSRGLPASSAGAGTA